MVFVSQVKAECNRAAAVHSDGGASVKRGSNAVQVSNKRGVSVSCDLTLEVCSLTLDGWLHGRKT